MYTDGWDEHPFRDSYATFEEYPYCDGYVGTRDTQFGADIICN